MLGTTDLTDVHQVERLRRSVAMLSPGAWAFERSDALAILGALVAQLREQPRPPS